MRRVLYLALKDFQLEFRQHTMLASLFFLGLVLLFISSYGGKVLGLPADRATVFGLWAALIFTALLLITRTLSEESRTGCWDGLRLCPVPYWFLFLGKWLYGVFALAAVEAFLFPAALFFGGLLLSSPLLFGVVIFLSAAGMTAVGLLFALAGLDTEGEGVSIPAVTLPFLLPLLMLTVEALSALLEGKPAGLYVAGLFLYDLIFTTVAAALFSPEGL